MSKLRPGAWGWVGLVVYVLFYDSYCLRRKHDTLSCVFGDAIQHPLHRWPVILTWLVLTLHLFGRILPEPIRCCVARYDPIGNLANLIERA